MYEIEFVENGKVLLVTIALNKANSFNDKSLIELNKLMDELQNNPKYQNIPTIFKAPDDSKIFSAGLIFFVPAVFVSVCVFQR